MSTVTLTTPIFDRGTLRLTTRRAVRSEWIKLTTLRTTWITLGSVTLVLSAFGIISSAVVARSATTGMTAASSFTTTFGGTGLAVLVVGALGALVGAREHTSGMIRTTVAAVPRRPLLLTAKAATLAGMLAVFSTVGVVVAAVVGTGLLRSGGVPTLALSDPLALRAMLGSVVYLVCIALIGMAVGLMLRSVAGSVATVVGVVMVLPSLAAALLPASWDGVLEVMPAAAGEAFMTVDPGTVASLSPIAGLADFVGWVVLALAAAALVLRRRDV